MLRATSAQARALFGNAGPPREVHEAQFDGFDEKLERLARTPYADIPEDDLWYYLHDLQFVPLQPDLFAYLFPRCLDFWRDSLLDGRLGCSIGDADLNRALARDNWRTVATPEQVQGTYDFLRDAMLDRLDRVKDVQQLGTLEPQQRMHALNWMYRFLSLGVILPDVAPAWNAWWAMSSPGCATAALAFMWGLATPLTGRYWNEAKYFWGPVGGDFWLWDADVFDHGWREANVAFVRRLVTVDYLRERAARAAEVAGPDQAALAHEVQTWLTTEPERVELRLEEWFGRLAEDDLVHCAITDWTL